MKSSAYVGYTSIWNLLGYAALAVPVTAVSRERDLPGREWLEHVPRNKGDEFNKEQCMWLFLPLVVVLGVMLMRIFADDVDLVDGMPVGVQVVGGRFGEEKCVAVAKAIEQAMRRKDEARPSL